MTKLSKMLSRVERIQLHGRKKKNKTIEGKAAKIMLFEFFYHRVTEQLCSSQSIFKHASFWLLFMCL